MVKTKSNPDTKKIKLKYIYMLMKDFSCVFGENTEKKKVTNMPREVKKKTKKRKR